MKPWGDPGNADNAARTAVTPPPAPDLRQGGAPMPKAPTKVSTAPSAKERPFSEYWLIVCCKGGATHRREDNQKRPLSALRHQFHS